MNGELLQAIEQIGREKGIDSDIIISAVEDAILAASKKYFKTNEELSSRFNREDGSLEVFAIKRVVERISQPDKEISLEEARVEIDESAQVDDIVEIPKPTEALGRIAAQAAKQIIYQKVREAEREIIHQEYKDRVGELVNGIVKRFERGNIIVDHRSGGLCQHRSPGGTLDVTSVSGVTPLVVSYGQQVIGQSSPGLWVLGL